MEYYTELQNSGTFQQKLRSETYWYIDSLLQQTEDLFFEPLEVITYKNDIESTTSIEKGLAFSYFNRRINSRRDDLLLDVFIRIAPHIITYTRKYPRLVDVLSQIGGFKNLLWVFFTLFYHFYNKRR